MKKLWIVFLCAVPLSMSGMKNQVVLEDGKPCSLTVEDLERIDALEREYNEKTASRKREIETGAQEVEKRVRPVILEAFFTCEGATPIQDRLIELINQGNARIRGAQYVFANWPLAKAIAHHVKTDGTKAEFLVDRGFKDMHSTNCLISLLTNGIKVRVPSKPEFKKLMHDKFLIFEGNDGQKVLVTGSYNLSYQANKNDENILITNDPAIIAQFEQKLDELMASSHSLQQKVSSQGVLLGSLQSCPTQHTQNF